MFKACSRVLNARRSFASVYLSLCAIAAMTFSVTFAARSLAQVGTCSGETDKYSMRCLNYVPCCTTYVCSSLLSSVNCGGGVVANYAVWSGQQQTGTCTSGYSNYVCFQCAQAVCCTGLGYTNAVFVNGQLQCQQYACFVTRSALNACFTDNTFT